MIHPDPIKEFLSAAENISIGYSEINFLEADKLEEGQKGYSTDAAGKSLLRVKGGWQAKWIVIARDHLGDPIFVDTASKQLAILTATHDEGSWDEEIIAGSLEQFGQLIVQLKAIGAGRANPAELEEKPISEKERQAFLKYVKANNRSASMMYWDDFLEAD